MTTHARFSWYPNAHREIRQASTSQRVDIAEEIVRDAQDAAPVVSGAYREGMHVETDGEDVFVVDDDPDAFFKEYGTSDTPPHLSLTEAAKQFGTYSRGDG